MGYTRLGLFVASLLLNALCHAAETPATDPEKLQAFNKSYAEFNELLQEENTEQALLKGQEAFGLAMDIFGDAHKTTAELAYSYGELLYRAGKYSDAKTVLTEAITIHENAYGSEAIELVPVLGKYVDSLAQFINTNMKDPEAISSALERALTIHKKHRPDDRLGYAELNTRVAYLLILTEENHTEAMQILEESLSIFEEAYGSNAKQLIQVLMALGYATADPLNPSKQRLFYNRALDITKINYPDDPIGYADLALTSGKYILQLSKSVDAKSYLLDAYSTFEKILGSNDYKTALSALALGEYYFSTQERRTAEKYAKSALPVFSSNPDYRNSELRARGLLVEIYERGRKSELATEQLLAIGRIAPWTPDQDVQPIFTVIPNFPEDTFWDVKGGWVIIDFTVDENGRVQDAVVESFEGHLAYMKATLKAVKKFRYAPRFVDGKPVATTHLKFKMIFEKK